MASYRIATRYLLVITKDPLQIKLISQNCLRDIAKLADVSLIVSISL